MIWSMSFFFFFNDTATTEIYTLSLHDALPILDMGCYGIYIYIYIYVYVICIEWIYAFHTVQITSYEGGKRSEEHTSELQSHLNLVCRLLLEKKKTRRKQLAYSIS